MDRNKLNIEELFRSQMDSYTVEPSAGLWTKMSSRIFWKQFTSFSFQSFNVYYLSAILAVSGLGTYALLNNSIKKAPETEQQIETTHIPEARETTQQEPIITPAEEKSIESRKDEPERPAEKPESPDVNVTPAEKDDAQGLPGSESKKQIATRKISKTSPADEETGAFPRKKSEQFKVSAGFIPSTDRGCSPVAVSFENISENAESYYWTFGDGGSSQEKNPSYVFDEPGEYPILLKIQGTDGAEYISRHIIRVFETPKAVFEMDDVPELSSSQPVYFYNYSREADFYEWDFGDGERSDLLEPIHYYDKPGTYNVSLKVWTSNQCYDSIILINAFKGADDEIHFPTAFMPSPSGATGGYYEENDVRNNIFHPVIKGELIEYQLKIFNRQGVLIFESNDVSIGWDGYYQEKLAGQSVYIWKARGKFSSGKTFVKSGDVTLVKQH